MSNYYQTLGLPEDAAMEAIQLAYRKALHRFHLHQQEGNPLPAADFDALQLAYNTLRDPTLKTAYDQAVLGNTPSAPAQPQAVIDEPAPPSEPPVSAPAPRELPGENVQHRFEFTGAGGEYFRIWIVNLLLTILTLGIYSAWAKVRREQYFHRNTLLDNSGFDYHGDPKAILKGRAVAWTMVLMLSVVENLAPLLYPVALLIMLPLVPWLMVRSFTFRARNTSYRGLHFDFHGSYKEAFKVFIGYGLLTFITLGIALPVFLRQIKLFQLNNLSFGGERFESNPALGAYFGIFIRASLIAFVPLALAGILAAVVMGAASQGGGAAMMAMMGGVALLIGLVYLVVLVVVQPYIQVRSANLVWNHTRLGQHQLLSDQTVKGLLPIFVLNWVLTLITLGLYWPWAKIKLAAYRAEHTALETRASLDDFIGQASQQQQALGEEVADAFDLDIAI